MACRALDETLHTYVALSGVMMHVWLCCKIFVITTGYHPLYIGILYITWVPIGRRLMCTWTCLE